MAQDAEGMMPGPITHVIFDCDGVLIDSEIISARMLIAALADRGVTIDLDYVAQHFLGRSYPTVMKAIRTEFGVDLPPDFEEDYRARLLAAFETGLKIMPGVREVLTGVGVPWCVATSSSRMRAERSLQIVGLAGLVGERLFTAGEVQHGKPAPDLFLHAAEELGAEPARCLVIEDSLNGIRAARAAGMAVWRFTGGTHLAGRDLSAPDGTRADLEFASFAEFFQIAPQLKGPQVA
jgi:HAD superfamily hydrolase (TIGR01509 family)